MPHSKQTFTKWAQPPERLAYLLLVVLLSTGCNDKEVTMNQDSVVPLYIEVITGKDGASRYGIAHPKEDGAEMYTFEAQLPAEGASHKIVIKGQGIELFVRQRKEQNE